jgi:YidC/Oxa1 family membrane protein insertase
MNPENKNALIGMLLIVAILMGWNYMMAPSEAQLQAQKRTADSTAMVQRMTDSLNIAKAQTAPPPPSVNPIQQPQGTQAGGIQPIAVTPQEQLMVIENQDIAITFTSKGGRIKQVLMKKFQKMHDDAQRVEQYSPLYLLEDAKNHFGYMIPTNGFGDVSTESLFFTPTVSGNRVSFSAALANGVTVEQQYILGAAYDLDYTVKFNGLPNLIRSESKGVQLNFENYLDKLEKNVSYERNYSFLSFREIGEARDYLTASKLDTKTLDKPVQWISHANQFFNTTLMAPQGGFKSAIIENDVYDDKSEDLKKMVTKIEIPTDQATAGMAMKMYIGPNDYSILKKYDNRLEEIVDYGGSILGTINRWIIRPLFDFLHSIIGNVAICILLLTFIVKASLYPLSYGMLKSQAKTAALKPEIEKMKAKYKDDSQKIQVEQMKLYQEYGVNPLGGCLPTLLQMPIWMALFRFFPATIDFRQQKFLWATDLSGFEEFIKLPFHIPMYGAHISLFALLWGASLIFFTIYSMKDVDMSAQPAGMKQLQYFSPILFMVMFNSYAAGLSLYMLFSNILNIAQTIITKNYVINHEAIRAMLETNKKNPKKKSAFREKFDNMLKEQQAAQKQQQEQQATKKKK